MSVIFWEPLAGFLPKPDQADPCHLQHAAQEKCQFGGLAAKRVLNIVRREKVRVRSKFTNVIVDEPCDAL